MFSFLKDFTYLILEKGETREKEGEKYRCERETLITIFAVYNVHFFAQIFEGK